MEALDTLVKQGKVRYVGCSNYSGWHIMKALGVAERAQLPALRQPADPLHAPCARGRVRTGADRARPGPRHPRLVADRGRAAVGQVPPRQPAPRARATPAVHAEPPVYDWEKLYDIIEVVIEVGDEHGVSGAQVALAGCCSGRA